MRFNITIPKGIFNPAYLPRLEAYDKRYEIYYGGAGSGKSVFVAQKKLYHILKSEGRNLLIVRKVGKDNRHSTYALIKKTIYRWDCEQLFTPRETDMGITCLNGNQIMFAGLDDVTKLKSITFQNGELTDIWMEEADQITPDDYELLDMRLRGKSSLPYTMTFSFNPVSALSWLKKEFFDIDRSIDTSITKTTWKDNNFIDDAFKSKLEKLKDKNPTLYNIYALGEWGILGELIFTNYEMHGFDINLYRDNPHCGLDFGYNDPSAYVEAAIKDQELYILQEFYRSELTNSDLIAEIQKIHNSKNLIIADSAEPDRIKEFKRAGVRIIGSEKGKDSVRAGIDFIRRMKIHIHPSCVNFLKEIQSYSYEKDKNGNVLEDPVDFNDHLMAALRYALERVRKNKVLKAMQAI